MKFSRIFCASPHCVCATVCLTSLLARESTDWSVSANADKLNNESQSQLTFKIKVDKLCFQNSFHLSNVHCALHDAEKDLYILILSL
jgi:hypothetical protein